MIRITFRNGNTAKWKKKEYTDYRYDGKVFIITRNGERAGIYNMDSIASVIIKRKKKKCGKGK